MINLKEKVSEATEEGERVKLRFCCARMEVDKRYKVTLGGVQTCSVAKIQAQLCFFDVMSCVNTDCSRLFLCQTC